MAAIPQHRLNIHQKPRQGSAFLRSFQTYQYRHRLTALGGCDSASFILTVSFNEAEWLFENCIGNAARIYVDDPVEPIFDGYISRISYKIGGVNFSISIEEMFNRTRVSYFDNPTATTTATTNVNDAASEAIYMRKQGVIEGEVSFTGGATQKQNIRSVLRTRSAWPLTSMSPGEGGLVLEIELRGWYQVWNWDFYSNTTTTTANADIIVRELFTDTSLATVYVNAAFIYATGTGAGSWSALLQSNAAPTPRECTNEQSYLEILEGICAAGLAGVKWVAGITKFNHFDANTNGRRVYFRPARTSAFYYQRALTEPGVFRDALGRKIDPWRVEADRVVQVTDVLFGWNGQGLDPRATYIETVDYDAESQRVTYTGVDDITPQGVLGARQRFKMRGRGTNRAPVRWRT